VTYKQLTFSLAVYNLIISYRVFVSQVETPLFSVFKLKEIILSH